MSEPVNVVVVEMETPSYDAMLRLREEVLRKPLGLKLRVEDVANDKDAIHFAAYKGEAMCGCVILCGGSEVGQAVLRQMAVHDDYQGQGVGRKLVMALETEAQRLGLTTIRLHARESALDFYQKLGYTVVSDWHAHGELGINHAYMEKTF